MNITVINAPPDAFGECRTLAIIARPVVADELGDPASVDRGQGVHFLTSVDHPQQVALIRHPAGVWVRPHSHLPTTRLITGTAETLLFQSGRTELSVYDEARNLVATETLGPGSIAVLLAGGHALTILEDTEFVEVKQGPYYGRHKDKIEFGTGAEQPPPAWAS